MKQIVMRVFLAIRYLNKPYLEVSFFASNRFFLRYLIREAKFPWPGATGATGSLIPGNDSHARVGERAPRSLPGSRAARAPRTQTVIHLRGGLEPAQGSRRPAGRRCEQPEIMLYCNLCSPACAFQSVLFCLQGECEFNAMCVM